MPASDLWTIRVPIDIRAVENQPSSTKSALLARVKELAPDPSVFEGDDAKVPFLFRSTISTNKIDSYGTEMRPSTLQNFADDAANGVPVLESHNSFNLPIGRSLTGKYSGPQGTGTAQVRADAYITPGLHNGRVSTDDLILGIRSGVYTDVSVGFRGGEVICSICNGPMFGRGATCPHWPGDTVTDDAGANPRVAIGRVENANLGEYSMVYDGATPGAMVDKIYRMTQAGEMTYSDVRRLRARYDFDQDPIYDILTKRESTPAEPATPKGEPMPNEEQRNEQAETLSRKLEEINAGIRDALKSGGAPDGVELRWLADEVTRLRPLADMGNAYRADLIESAVVEGRRARGTEFTEETWRGMMAGMSIDQIKQVRADFEAIAKIALPTGRASVEGEPAETPTAPAPSDRGVPAAYYRA